MTVKTKNTSWEERNRERANFIRKRWAKNNPEKRALIYKKCCIKRFYGINYDEYLKMIEFQENKCKLCGNIFSDDRLGTKPAVDHCHKTNKIRGILCGRCNLAIGNFDESLELMEKAIKYLKDNT